ncbi:MAG: M24 family metallopeptidase, partial [Candidatus Hodarchaeota archaeon]
RTKKDEEEIKCLKEASKRTGETIIQVMQELEVGVTEVEVRQKLVNMLKTDSDVRAGGLVQFGENSALPHYHGGSRKLKVDDVVLIDCGRTYNDYWGDITITSVFGKATEGFRKVFEIVKTSNQQAKEAVISSGIPAEIDTAARNFISEKGYGKYFTHRTGHGIGLEGHEEPYIVGSNKKPLVIGNSFTIEPGIYLPGKFGVRIEDDVIRTEDGYWSSEFPRDDLIEI